MNVEKLEKILRLLSSTIQSVKIYTTEHPKAQQAIDDVFAAITDYNKSFGECEFGLANEEIFSGKEIFFDLSKQLKELINLLLACKIQRLYFKKSLLKHELESFLSLLTQAGEEDFTEFAKANSVSFANIYFGHLGAMPASSEQVDRQSSQKRQKGLRDYQAMLESNNDLVNSLIQDEEVNPQDAYNFSCDLFNMATFNRESLFTLMNLKRHDDYTFVHSLNVAVLAMFQAEYLGLERKDIIRLGMAGMLHDSGKKRVKNIVLNKKEKLDESEFKMVQSHTLAGVEVLLSNENVDPMSVVAAYQHHIGVKLERYPKAVYLKRQSMIAKIIAVSDVYDALRSRRSYKESMPLEQVYEIMQREKGRVLDTELVDLFFKNLGFWPEGTLVRLNTGEIALVKKINPDEMYLPVIEIVYDDKDNLLEESQVIDLADQNDLHIKRQIEKHITPDTDIGKKYVAGLYG